MTSAVTTMSAFQSPAEVKTSPQFGRPNVSDLDQSQSPNNFIQPYQSNPFNPFFYLSYTAPSNLNAHPVITNAQQTFNSTSVVQDSQSKSLAPFACGICGKEFGMRCRLVAHIRRHTGERPFSCTECGRAFSDAGNLQRHRYVHSSEPRFHCTVCGKSFRQASCLSTHRRFHCPGAEGRICLFCRRTFKSSASLQMHLRFKHRADAEAVVAVAVGSISSDPANSSGEGDPQHEKAMPVPASPEGEQLSNTDRQPSCNNSQDSDARYRGVAMAAAAAFRRNFAHADSPTVGSTGSATPAFPRPPDRWRKAHVRKQVKVDESAIPTLEGITTDQLKLVAAAVAVGGSDGSSVSPGSALDAKGRAFNFPCPACPRRFVFQCRLAAHLRSHTNFRPFTCPDCGRAFTQRGYLVRHAAVHANERPFVCALCDRAYKHYGSLVNHRRTHSKSSGAGISNPSSKPRSRLATSSSGPLGYRCVPTMAPPAAPTLPMWASAGIPFAASASVYHSSAISQSQQHQTIFFRTPFSYLPTPQ
ncbi:unnamed protein product [Hydatigera taeniaeformis]|uniref:C2H2-type domain-containing protein n=1 Tax=Hydatigena taeniaeformis TaxID=6205 RepID=A0A0R3X3W8_HYDTA|nr:unnamed protein product [Hydatigera taeniaeformis]